MNCDFCNKPAIVDGKTKGGPWAYMCERHFKSTGIDKPGFYSKIDANGEVIKPARVKIEK